MALPRRSRPRWRRRSARWPASASRPGSSSKAGRERSAWRSCCSIVTPPATTVELDRGLLVLPEPRPGDLSSTSRATPIALDDGRRLPVRASSTRWRKTAGGPPPGRSRSKFERLEPDEDRHLGAERHAFERTRRPDHGAARAADPSMHVYHYAPYEPTALGRPHGRLRDPRGGGRPTAARAVSWSTCSASSGRASGPGSRATRSSGWSVCTDSTARSTSSDAGSRASWPSRRGSRSVSAGAGRRGDLERIERYNRDDVVSNWRLRDWLEGRRDELAAMTGRAVPRPACTTAPLPAEVTENEARVLALVERLAGPADGAGQTRLYRYSQPNRPDVAAGPAPELAPPRGQVDVVGVPSADGSHAGGARR